LLEGDDNNDGNGDGDGDGDDDTIRMWKCGINEDRMKKIRINVIELILGGLEEKRR
jgi:hypothetical protein